MKTITFNGKSIINSKQPSPKKNQIWKSEQNTLIKVVEVYKTKGGILNTLCETETGSRFGMGVAWFNGHEYMFIGTIL